MEPEDLDAVPERSVPDSPVDVGTAHMEAPIDWEVLARLRGLQGEDEPDIVAELAGTFLERRRAGCGAGGAHAQRWLWQYGRKGDVRPLRAVGGRWRVRTSLAGLRTARTDQGGVGAARAGAGGRGFRFQVKWFQPVKPWTGSPLRMKTTSDWVICPISVRGTSTFFATASRT